MKRTLFTIAFLAILTTGLYAEVSTAQTPPVQITFTCNLDATKCGNYRDLLATAFQCVPAQGQPPLTNAQKITCIQNRTINYLHRLVLDQKKDVDIRTQINTTEAAFRADFPDQP